MGGASSRGAAASVALVLEAGHHRAALTRLLIATLLATAACGGADEMRIVNRLEHPASLDIRAPREDLRGHCDVDFRERYCTEEYVQIGTFDVQPSEDRFLTISDPVTDERCTNVLWLRLRWLGDVGPVSDPGITIQLPAVVEIEAKAGLVHAVAFPQGTVRLDEVGSDDVHQGPSPSTCDALGRSPR